MLMVSPEITQTGLERLKNALCSIERKPAVTQLPPVFVPGLGSLGIRDAMLLPGRRIPVEESEGCILAAASVGCPPAVPILVCGEIIDRHAIECFQYYGIQSVMVTAP